MALCNRTNQGAAPHNAAQDIAVHRNAWNPVQSFIHARNLVGVWDCRRKRRGGSTLTELGATPLFA